MLIFIVASFSVFPISNPVSYVMQMIFLKDSSRTTSIEILNFHINVYNDSCNGESVSFSLCLIMATTRGM